MNEFIAGLHAAYEEQRADDTEFAKVSESIYMLTVAKNLIGEYIGNQSTIIGQIFTKLPDDIQKGLMVVLDDVHRINTEIADLYKNIAEVSDDTLPQIYDLLNRIRTAHNTNTLLVKDTPALNEFIQSESKKFLKPEAQKPMNK